MLDNDGECADSATPARVAEVEAIRKGAALDRFALQAKLMPYEHLLPPRLRGRNERIDERFEDQSNQRAAKRAAS